MPGRCGWLLAFRDRNCNFGWRENGGEDFEMETEKRIIETQIFMEMRSMGNI